MSTDTARVLLEERAASYSRDARKFSDAARLGKPITGSAESDNRWASTYRAIARELRKVRHEMKGTL